MNYETVRYIIIGAIVLGVTIFILRSFVKAAIVALLVVLLFRIGWVYTGEDIENSMFLNKILHPDFIESIVESYEGFADKRDELGEMIDPETLEETVRDEIKDKVNEYLDGSTDDGTSEEDMIPDENTEDDQNNN